MKKNCKMPRGIILVTLALMLMSIALSAAYALPGTTVKVNGKLFNPYFEFDGPYAKPRYGNTITLEIKAKWVEGSLQGSGSLHGINCHSTFFFDDLTGTKDDVLTLTGTVTSTSTPFKEWIGTPIQLVTDLSGYDMHLIIAGFIDFAGTGKVVL